MSRSRSVPPISLPFFYGWLVIGVSMVTAFLAAPTGSIFMAIMLKPMSEDLGWSRSETAGAITMGTVAAGVVSPLAGVLADRFGPRLITPVGALAVSLALFSLAGTTALWQFYLAYAVSRALSNTALSGVVPLTTATNWFRQKRGRALGFISMAFPLGGSVATFVGQQIMGLTGWRTVFLILGAALVSLGIFPTALILRRRPEDVGLLPDGVLSRAEEPNQAPIEASRPQSEESFSLSQALRTPALWLIIGAQIATTTPSSALSYHMLAYYTDHGIAPSIAAAALSAFALFGALSSGLWGLLSERVSERFLAVGAMTWAAFCTVLMSQVRHQAFIVPIGGLLGLAARGEGALLNMLVARYFGRGSYGRITGIMQPFNLAGLGLGPLLAALAYDFTGTYEGAFAASVALYLVGGLLISQARPPQPPSVNLQADSADTAKTRGR